MTRNYSSRGSHVVMARGQWQPTSLRTGGKMRFELRWKGLTKAQVTTVKTAWATVYTASVAFTTPLGGSYTVTRDVGAMARGLTWYKGGGVMRADVSMKLREV